MWDAFKDKDEEEAEGFDEEGEEGDYDDEGGEGSFIEEEEEGYSSEAKNEDGFYMDLSNSDGSGDGENWGENNVNIMN